MGVTGLWSILHPCARPIKLETLNRKRLAVDASIWIYQFLKAVRDKEGNALRNSHVVGFFRRICKLLFFGIKPVFVFDGDAPALKRQTIAGRKQRREGRREDAVRTAGRLLAVQMQRRAEVDEQRRKEEDEGSRRREEVEEEVPDEGLVYADENLMSAQERQQSRKFRKKDAYHLPDLDVSMNEMGQPNDPRIMSLEELQAYAKQFETGEDINVYDFSKIDYDSSFFTSLPATDRYNILNAARLRSRLRMGHSKEQLDSMFPDRMAFSKFQIERVTERNELTQRLMNVNEGGDRQFDGGGRVAGEKGREYVLVKNDGVEGGWALGVIGGDEGTKQETAINLDEPASKTKREDEDWEDEDDFEDVPIEGLNRLPKKPRMENGGLALDAFSKQRQSLYKSRRSGTKRKPKAKTVEDPNSLFVQDAPAEDEVEEWEEVDADSHLFGEPAGDEEEDEELQRALTMSLEKDQQQGDTGASSSSDEDMIEPFNQRAAPEAQPIPKGGGRAIANLVNKRAFDVAPESHEVTHFGVPVPRSPDLQPLLQETEVNDDDDDEPMTLQAALAESRRTKRKVASPRKPPPRPDQAKIVAKQAGFSGPLPFEKLDLGSSLLGKKKMQARSEETAGGFENPQLEDQQERERRKKAGPMPPWFSGGDGVEEDVRRQRVLEAEDRERAREFDRQFRFQRRDEGLRRRDTGEVIDLEAEEDDDAPPNRLYDGEAIDLDADEGEDKDGKVGKIGDGMVTFDPEIRMGDLAEKGRAEPVVGERANYRAPTPPQKPSLPRKSTPPRPSTPARAASPPQTGKAGPFMVDDSDEEDGEQVQALSTATESLDKTATDEAPQHEEEEEEMLDWSDSEDGRARRLTGTQVRESEDLAEHAGGSIQKRTSKSPSAEFEDVDMDTAKASPPELQKQTSRSPSVEFEDVDITKKPATPATVPGDVDEEEEPGYVPSTGLADQDALPEDVETAEFDDFSDPEDEELLRQLTLEAEEHARFASTLNHKTPAQNAADYEKELKQLRNQQKKDRRDADGVTHIMVQECQQLLRLFGLPYVTAPMEAEAQCAELVRLGLVDGIVTDDSDCFLFGGTRVYKNFFNQGKFVECYLSADLEKEFQLSREKLIQVAHLLGSDYTEGLPGVGPVTALEILGEFQSLEAFKEWWTGVQMNIIPKSVDAGSAFRKKFRRNAQKLFLPPIFPDARVDIAYHQPAVDSDPEAFQWGVPDLDALRTFLMATIGWTQERTDEVLVPVIKDMNRRADEGTQANLTAYFEGGVGVGAAGNGKGGEGFAPRKKLGASKRMGSALSRMAERAKIVRSEGMLEGEVETESRVGGSTAQVGGELESQQASATTNKQSAAGKKAKPTKRTKRLSADHESSDVEEGESDFEQPKRKARKTASSRGRRKKVQFSD